MILLIDNYDSFVYNLARYFVQLGHATIVKRNDAITIDQIRALKPSHIIISPGPCSPNEAGISMKVIEVLADQIPILGVCLGHQAIGQVFGGTINTAKHPMHGKSSLVTHDATGIFSGLNNPLMVGRYHSLVVCQENLPQDLKVIAYADDGEIMGLQHITYPLFGVQFHPESVLTEQGHDLLHNFIVMTSTQ